MSKRNLELEPLVGPDVTKPIEFPGGKKSACVRVTLERERALVICRCKGQTCFMRMGDSKQWLNSSRWQRPPQDFADRPRPTVSLADTA